jgi:hypothetical protein
MSSQKSLLISFLYAIFIVFGTAVNVNGAGVPPGISGKIAYYSYSDYLNWDGKIYLLDLSLHTCQCISSNWNLDHAIKPHFSPDGTKLVFMAVPKGAHNYNSWEIYMWDIGTLNLTRLTNNSIADEYPRFSPNGQLIVFKRNGHIYLMKAEPESSVNIPNRITTNSLEESMPFYIKDGTFRILYSSRSCSNADIHLVDESGANDYVLFARSNIQDNYPVAWYGNKFLFTSWAIAAPGCPENTPPNQVYVGDINSRQIGYLPINNGYESKDNLDAYPIDRKYILFSSNRAGVGSYDIFIGDVETGDFWSISQFGGINTANAELGATYCPTSNSSEFYDDFSYTNNNDSQLSSFQWYIRNEQGGPDSEEPQCSRDNIQFVADLESSNNRLLRVVSKTSGTSQSSKNGEIGQQNNRFYEGTYGARVFLTDSPKLWQDETIQGFFTINGLPHNDPNYGECDFEYLAYDKWWGVGITPAMYFTTWDVVPDPLPWDPTYKRTDWLQRSLAGWHILLIQIGNSEVNYLIDGVSYASHGGDYYPEQPMRILFSQCFGDYLNNSSVERTYVMDVDWVYHAKNAILTTPEVQSIVDNYRSRNLGRLDTMLSAASPILSVNLNEMNVSSRTIGIDVYNIGNGAMLWSASVAFGNSWLTITSGASGTNSGMISLSYAKNVSGIPRMGAIRITTEGAKGSPQYITVVQAPGILAYSGGTGEPNDPYKIANAADFNQLSIDPNNWNKFFILTADVNLAGITLMPVGNSGKSFTGVFEGNGHIIRNVVINQPGSDYIGLFGRIEGQIRNLGVENVNITGWHNVGGLVGNNSGSLTACYATGSVGGVSQVGGLLGINGGSLISCYSTCSVSGTYAVGGLVGNNSGSLTACYAAGSVSGTYAVGGLVGSNGGLLTSCFGDMQTSRQTDGVGSGTSTGVTGKTTAEMKTLTTFTSAGWDFLGETTNGTNDIWRMCVDGIYYPHLTWEYVRHGDFACPDGTDVYDLAIFKDQWLLEKLSHDTSPNGGDGIVNFIDWATFVNQWKGNTKDLAAFASEWLKQGAYFADIASVPGGDGVVNFVDFAIIAKNWP